MEHPDSVLHLALDLLAHDLHVRRLGHEQQAAARRVLDARRIIVLALADDERIVAEGLAAPTVDDAPEPFGAGSTLQVVDLALGAHARALEHDVEGGALLLRHADIRTRRKELVAPRLGERHVLRGSDRGEEVGRVLIGELDGGLEHCSITLGRRHAEQPPGLLVQRVVVHETSRVGATTAECGRRVPVKQAAAAANKVAAAAGRFRHHASQAAGAQRAAPQRTWRPTRCQWCN